jgi:hypothetical protein
MVEIAVLRHQVAVLLRTKVLTPHDDPAEHPRHGGRRLKFSCGPRL